MVLGFGVCEFLCACESSVLPLDFENLGFEPSAFGPLGLFGSCEKRLLRCGARIVRMAGEPQELCRDLNLQIFHLQTLSSEQMPDTPNLCLTSQRPNTTIHAQFQLCTNRELQLASTRGLASKTKYLHAKLPWQRRPSEQCSPGLAEAEAVQMLTAENSVIMLNRLDTAAWLFRSGVL